jgi:hypothetical protein
VCWYSDAEIEAAIRLESALADPSVQGAAFDRNSRSTIIFENEYELAGWLGQLASMPVTVRALSQTEAEAAVGYMHEIAGTEGPNAVVRLELPTHQIMTAFKGQDTISEDDAQRFKAGVAVAAVEIADGCPPEWLTSGLYAAAGEIARGFRSDARYPKGHKEFRDKLGACPSIRKSPSLGKWNSHLCSLRC